MSMLHNFSRSSIKKSPFSSHFLVVFGSNRFNSASILLVGLANIFFGSVSAGAAESNPITTSDSFSLADVNHFLAVSSVVPSNLGFT